MTLRLTSLMRFTTVLGLVAGVVLPIVAGVARADDSALMLDLGGRAFLGDKHVPRDGAPLAFHIGGSYFHSASGESGPMFGARYDQFLFTAPGAHSHILNGSVGWGAVARGAADLHEIFVGFRHVNDVRGDQDVLGRAGGPTLGYRQRYGFGTLHVFWEVAALSYAYTAPGGGRVGLEARLRVAYGIGTIEWYLRLDPATGGELGIGFGGADAFTF